MVKRKGSKSIIVAILLLLIGLLQQKGYFQPITNTVEQNQPGLYKVISFVDGDTITIDMNGKQEKVRLIGVDTPETHDPRKPVQCFGSASANFTKNIIGSNRVRLEADPTNTNRDRYNRLLRYVYLPDGTLINGEIIKQGYGFAYTYFPFTKINEFKEYQKNAEQQKNGLWDKCIINNDQDGVIN